jgi:hypothetical protein
MFIGRHASHISLFRWFSPHHLVASFLSQEPGFNLKVNKVKLVHKAATDRFLFLIFDTACTNCHSTNDSISICITAGTLGTSKDAISTNWDMTQLKNKSIYVIHTKVRISLFIHVTTYLPVTS